MPTKIASPKTITPKELSRLRYPLPESLIKAAGILRHRKKELEQHIKKVRQEWERSSIVK